MPLIETRNTEMKPDTPKPTPAEKKFDRAQEEAFSNEGAPPPAGASVVAANADRWGVDEGRAAASALTSTSPDNPASACEATAKTMEGTLATDMPEKDAARAQPDKGTVVGGVCSLLPVKSHGRAR